MAATLWNPEERFLLEEFRNKIMLRNSSEANSCCFVVCPPLQSISLISHWPSTVVSLFQLCTELGGQLGSSAALQEQGEAERGLGRKHGCSTADWKDWFESSSYGIWQLVIFLVPSHRSVVKHGQSSGWASVHLLLSLITAVCNWCRWHQSSREWEFMLTGQAVV